MSQKKNPEGLTDKQVLESRQKHGENLLSPPHKESLWKLFWEKFEDPIIRILLVAAFLSLGISFVHNEFAETIGIFCAIFLSVGVAFWFEMDANKKFDVLNQVNDDTLVKVIRNGNISEVLKKEIVVGDIIVLDTGEEIPADAELLEAISLQVNESSLTGEPVISKSTDAKNFRSDATYPSNMIYRGTTIVDGHCTAEVIAVGDNTEFGKVAHEATKISEEETPLNKQLGKLAQLIGSIGFFVAVLTFTTLFLKDLFFDSTPYSNTQILLVGISIISVLIALAKAWVPIVFDGIKLVKKGAQLPKSIEKGGWLKWIGISLLTFIICNGLIYLIFNINPIDSKNWINIDEAGQLLQHFMIAVTLIVVAVPEGLPMSVTLSLAMSMQRMLRTNNLVRKMHACETMGATTVICTDKTGTLTQNQMQVYQTNFYGLNDQKLGDDKISSLIKEGISANSTAHLDFSNGDKIKSLGNPTEAALLLWLNSNHTNYLELRENAKVVSLLTFSTERKFMATLVDSPQLGKRILYVKGAPEIVFSKCTNIATKDGLEKADAFESSVNKQLLDYQNQAMRTLGFAYKEIDISEETDIQDLVKTGLIFLGFVAISDPVRDDVPLAVEHCLEAGIQVKIVTGDTPGTAREIGRQIGVWQAEDIDENIITGPEFEALSDDMALARSKKLKIMCRARPTDKQRLVQMLQKNDEVVAVTGDGTNDAPALNFAQVGLSMGTGTSVAKEASDITLLDDSFNSIATAVLWGRSLYKNIQRFILFQLTINVTALILVFLGSIFGQELPLTITQMLWVNLIMDTFAAGALASLPPDPRVMKEKPRRNSDFIISSNMRSHILFTGITFVVLLLGLLYMFNDPEILAKMFPYISEPERGAYSLSVFFTTFVLLQFWNMFNAKAYYTGRSALSGLKNSMGFVLVSILILIGQFIIVEFGGDVFRTVPLEWRDWGIIIGGTSAVLWICEIKRLIKKG